MSHKVFIIMIVLAITVGVSWDIHRWHTFQEVTKSDIGYWKWKFVIEKSGSKAR